MGSIILFEILTFCVESDLEHELDLSLMEIPNLNKIGKLLCAQTYWWTDEGWAWLERLLMP